jgi:hypothetical protein
VGPAHPAARKASVGGENDAAWNSPLDDRAGCASLRLRPIERTIVHNDNGIVMPVAPQIQPLAPNRGISEGKVGFARP